MIQEAKDLKILWLDHLLNALITSKIMISEDQSKNKKDIAAIKQYKLKVS